MVKKFLVSYNILGVIMWVFIIVHQWEFPEYPIYLSSIVLTDSILFLWISAIHQFILTFLCWAQILLFLLNNVTFAQSMISCLDTLMSHENSRRLDFQQYQYRICSFVRLRDLMNSFNEVFKWHMFVQMAGAVTYICLACYVPLRYWNILGWPSIIQMGCAALVISFGMMWNYYLSMGQVWEKSSKFENAMKGLLCTFPLDSIWLSDAENKTKYKRLKMQISTCSGFGFKGGNFFVFKTATLLTVFYSVITHIIILLQLDI